MEKSDDSPVSIAHPRSTFRSQKIPSLVQLKIVTVREKRETVTRSHVGHS